jgi:hypothetical protein
MQAKEHLIPQKTLVLEFLECGALCPKEPVRALPSMLPSAACAA